MSDMEHAYFIEASHLRELLQTEKHRVAELERIIGQLLAGIMHWAMQEDGIPDYIAPAFNEGMTTLNWTYSDMALTALDKTA